MKNKLVIFTAPSGAGKTTIVQHLLKVIPELAFSVSAASRPRRSNEVEGLHYYFIDKARFLALIEEQAFVEWQEVYQGQYYGTLKKEIERLWSEGKSIIFDIDVQGAKNLKMAFPQQTLAIFVKPPSKEILFERLRKRNTESEESLARRINKATKELACEHDFDLVLPNYILEDTLKNAEQIVRDFLKT